MRLNAILRAGVAAVCIVAIAAPAGFAETPPVTQRLPGSPLSVCVAQSHDFSRIEFRFAGGAQDDQPAQGPDPDPAFQPLRQARHDPPCGSIPRNG